MGEEWTTVGRLGLALALGLLVGFQRERGSPAVAGIRTFALTALFGALTAVLAAEAGAWLVVAGLVCVAAMLVVGNAASLRSGRPDPGATGEVAALVLYAIGAAVGAGYAAVPVAAAGAVALLLYGKRPLHALVHRVGEADLRAWMRLVLLGLVVLPAMPDRGYGPYGVVNPREIWWMVVLIVGISLAAYAAYRIVGPRRGTLVAGVLGGLISSTAATVGYAHAARRDPRHAATAAALVLLASAAVFARVLLEVALVAPAALVRFAGPLVAMGLVTGLLAAGLARRAEAGSGAVDREPPTDLRGPIVFGLLYAAVLVAVAYARDRYGPEGLYVVAAVSGLTDVDAITLSTARLVQAGDLAPSTGWRAVLIGVMANLVFKGLVVAALGPRALLARVGPAFGVALLAGAALFAWWP